MSSDQGPVVQRALLTKELTRLRKKAGRTQEDVASALEWHVSKVIRVEGGKTSLSRADLEALLSRYGVTEQREVDELAELARGARSRAWWDDHKSGIRDLGYLAYIGYEAGASRIRGFETLIIPGLLQTEDYALRITEGYVESWEVGPLVTVRLQRQRELRRRQKPPLEHYILDEAAIRRQVGIKVNPGIMPAQLEYLITMAENDNVTIQVIPFRSGAHFGMRGPFTILAFEGDLDDVVYLESGRRADQTLPSGDQRIPDYEDAFENLREDALSPDESLDLIRSAVEDMS